VASLQQGNALLPLHVGMSVFCGQPMNSLNPIQAGLILHLDHLVFVWFWNMRTASSGLLIR